MQCTTTCYCPSNFTTLPHNSQGFKYIQSSNSKKKSYIEIQTVLIFLTFLDVTILHDVY